MPISIDSIRWMIRADMDAVLSIENQSKYAKWAEEDFLACLRQRNCIGMVAESNTNEAYKIYGFVVYELLGEEIRILNIAVDKAYHRQGVGRAIIDKLKKRLNNKRTKLTLIVSERNLNAHLFFRNMGFKAIGILDNYYDKNTDDAYYMSYDNSNITIQET